MQQRTSADVIFQMHFSWRKHLLFTSAAYIQVHFRPDFFMEVNNMNPDQTAPKEAA